MKRNPRNIILSCLLVTFGAVFCVFLSLFHKHNIDSQNQIWQSRLESAHLFRSNPDQVIAFLDQNQLRFKRLNMSTPNQKGQVRYLMLIAQAEPVATFDWHNGVRHRKRELQFEFFDNDLFCYAVDTPTTLL